MVSDDEIVNEGLRAVTKVRAGVASVAKAGEECLSLLLADGFERRNPVPAPDLTPEQEARLEAMYPPEPLDSLRTEKAVEP